MWYLSCFGWRMIGGRAEPQYHLKLARSHDGLHWERDGSVAVEINQRGRGHRTSLDSARPNRWRMWYCHRSLDGYRSDKQSSYRIGYAESSTTGHTGPDSMSTGDSVPPAEGWDSEMAAYPAVYQQCRPTSICFITATASAASGFGYAVCEEGSRWQHPLSG